MLMRAGLGSLGALVLVLGACGDDSDGGVRDLAEMMEALPDDPRTEEQRQADAALAAQAVLMASDLPEGWSAEPQDASDDDDPLPPGLLDCLGVPEDLRDEFTADEDEVEASSDEFSVDDAETSSAAFVYPSPEHARVDFVFFEDADFVGCFEDEFRQEFEAQAEADGLPVENVELSLDLVDPPQVGEESIALHLELAFEVSDQRVRLISDFITFRVGRAVATIEFRNVNGPFDPALAQRLLTTLAGRFTGF